MSSASSLSAAKLAANRANAQMSTGPKTDFGKAKSALNAVKTGLTGRTILLPNEDAKAYEDHLLKYVDALAPVGEYETQLVQSLAETQWRLGRIPGLESATFALGRIKYADRFPEDMDAQARAALLDAYIAQEDAKHLKNLHLQENRLHRRYRQDLAELQTRQKARKDQEEAEKKAQAAKTPAVGFEFTTAEMPAQNDGTGPLSSPNPPSALAKTGNAL
jgi:hypothetical protein